MTTVGPKFLEELRRIRVPDKQFIIDYLGSYYLWQDKVIDIARLLHNCDSVIGWCTKIKNAFIDTGEVEEPDPEGFYK